MASKVLVIDNDSQVRGMVCAALERDGFVTVGVGSYSEAIDNSLGPRPVSPSVMGSPRMV